MLIENAESLRAWLTTVLKPLCDADPAALAKYVLALIKKDRPENELKQSMIDQLDVFLQQETKEFVELLFKTLANKSYLPLPEVVSAPAVDAVDKKPSSSPKSSAVNDIEAHSSSTKASTSEGDAGPTGTASVITTAATPPAAVFQSPAPESSPVVKVEKGLVSNKREVSGRKEDEKDRDTTRTHRKSRSPRRSPVRAHDRRQRSRSPRDREVRDREQYQHRGRHRGRKSPPRRYDRRDDNWDRSRRSDRRSPNRNRSASPRPRSRSPPARSYRRYHSRSRSRSRSPLRERSRSPIREKQEKKDVAVTPNVDTEMPAADTSEGKTHLQSVVRPVNHAEKSEGYSGTEGNKRCRDFDEQGLCMRGELCPYDHGTDPVVLEDISPRTGSADFLGSSSVYTPQILRPAMPMIGNPVMEPPMCWGGGVPPFRPRHMGMRHRLPLGRPPLGFPVMPQRELISIPVTGGVPDPSMMDMRGPLPPPMHLGPMPPRMRGGVHLGRGGRGRGGFDHGRLGNKPARNYANCSLEVKKIPPELNNIMDLNSHFLRFGKIVNIQINFENDPEAALITFSSPGEAHLAYRSTEAVLNNRFIRVFWHNKEKENDEGIDHGTSEGASARLSVKDRLGAPDASEDKLEQEKILVSGTNLTKTVYNPGLLAKKAETSSEKIQAVEAIKKSQEALSTMEQQKKVKEESQRNARKLMVDLRKRKQDMMREQIEQQKKLISKLELSQNKQERDGLMGLIKSLQESIEGIKKDLEESTKAQVANHAMNLPVKVKEEGISQKELLDAELDLIQKEQEGGDTNALQKKVFELRAQARGGIRGGRGKPMFRGASRGFLAAGRGARGKRFRLLRKVDRRPTTICVSGFDQAKMKDVLAQFSTFGPITYYDADPVTAALTLSFESRKKAEIAFTNGKKLDPSLVVEWVQSATSGSEKAGLDAASNGQAANQNDENNVSMEDEEMSDIYADELLFQYDDEEEEDDERSWRR